MRKTDGSNPEITPDKMSPRERRIARRREEILNAAANLFALQGFHRTTTKDIADAADIAEGTLYNYFESKDALLMALMGRLAKAQEMQAELSADLPIESRQFFLSMLKQRKEYFETYQPMLQSLMAEILVNPELRQKYFHGLVQPSSDLVAQNLSERMERNELRSFDPQITVRVLSALLNGLFLLDMLGDPLIDAQWDEISQVVTEILFDGLAVTHLHSHND